MTAEISTNCTQRLEEVKQWFGSRPRGVAEMRIETSDNPALPPVKIDIRTLL